MTPSEIAPFLVLFNSVPSVTRESKRWNRLISITFAAAFALDIMIDLLALPCTDRQKKPVTQSVQINQVVLTAKPPIHNDSICRRHDQGCRSLRIQAGAELTSL